MFFNVIRHCKIKQIKGSLFMASLCFSSKLKYFKC